MPYVWTTIVVTTTPCVVVPPLGPIVLHFNTHVALCADCHFRMKIDKVQTLGADQYTLHETLGKLMANTISAQWINLYIS